MSKGLVGPPDGQIRVPESEIIAVPTTGECCKSRRSVLLVKSREVNRLPEQMRHVWEIGFGISATSRIDFTASIIE
jgi:hypothetical protein